MNRSVSLPVAICVSLLALAGCKESGKPEDAAKTDGAAAITTDAQRMGYSLGASMVTSSATTSSRSTPMRWPGACARASPPTRWR